MDNKLLTASRHAVVADEGNDEPVRAFALVGRRVMPHSEVARKEARVVSYEICGVQAACGPQVSKGGTASPRRSCPATHALRIVKLAKHVARSCHSPEAVGYDFLSRVGHRVALAFTQVLVTGMSKVANDGASTPRPRTVGLAGLVGADAGMLVRLVARSSASSPATLTHAPRLSPRPRPAGTVRFVAPPTGLPGA